MPSVVGQSLELAKSDIERAGFTDDVEVVGGGILGVLDESNWEVCEQEPAAGQVVTSAPRLVVDRSCEDANPLPTEPGESSQPAPQVTEIPAEPTPSAPTGEGSASETTDATTLTEPSPSVEMSVLTIANSPDFAAISVVTDQCSPDIAAFAANHAGGIVQFEGSIGAMNNHGSYDTRYDVLINFGDDGLGTAGPNFQLRNVNLFDMNFVGDDIPETFGVGDNLRLTATVDLFEERSCLFLLDPVSTEFR